MLAIVAGTIPGWFRDECWGLPEAVALAMGVRFEKPSASEHARQGGLARVSRAGFLPRRAPTRSSGLGGVVLRVPVRAASWFGWP